MEGLGDAGKEEVDDRKEGTRRGGKGVREEVRKFARKIEGAKEDELRGSRDDTFKGPLPPKKPTSHEKRTIQKDSR